MEPLYDASVQLVGWIDDEEDADYIWDDGLEWPAYIADGCLVAALVRGVALGPVSRGQT